MIYLGNKIADHTTIIDAHSGSIGVEDSCNPHLQQTHAVTLIFEPM